MVGLTIYDGVVSAYDEYKAAYEAGDDGKPDWMARKACNYMTAAVEVGVCLNHIGLMKIWVLFRLFQLAYHCDTHSVKVCVCYLIKC